MQDGYGFLRSSDYHYLSSPDDVYVSLSIVARTPISDFQTFRAPGMYVWDSPNSLRTSCANLILSSLFFI